MNQTTIILLGVGVLAAGGAAYYFLRPKAEGEEKFRIQAADGTTITGTRAELIAMGYMEVMQDGQIKWVSREAYNQALQQAGGNAQSPLFGQILAAIASIYTVVQTIRGGGSQS